MMHIHGTCRHWFACCSLLLASMTAATSAMSTGPDPGDTVNAWYEVRDWVDDLRIPAESDAGETIRIADSTGCCIILRSQGRTVGIGTAREGASMIRDAARQAISNALGDHAISALPDAIRSDAGRQLTVELEVAGPLQPLIGDTFRDFENDIHPLRHGIALRCAMSGRWYPSRLRLVNNRAKHPVRGYGHRARRPPGALRPPCNVAKPLVPLRDHRPGPPPRRRHQWRSSAVPFGHRCRPGDTHPSGGGTSPSDRPHHRLHVAGRR